MKLRSIHTVPHMTCVADTPQEMALSVAGDARRCILWSSIAIVHASLALLITSIAADCFGERWEGGLGDGIAVYERRWMGAM